MSRRLPTLIVLALPPLLVFGCAPAIDPWEGETGSPRVVVSCAPIYSLVRAVGGDRPAVKCLCTTTGPHHYKTDGRDARMFEKADVVFAFGHRFDESFTEALRLLARVSKQPYHKLGEKLPKSALLDLKVLPGHETHGHGTIDPHVWLGVPQTVAMVKDIRDALSKIDPDGEKEYEKNAAAFVGRLEKILADGKEMLKGKKNRRIVCFHESLGYFAKSFDLEIADVIQVEPGTEPTPKELSDLVETLTGKDKPVAAIAVEPQYATSSTADTLIAEAKKRGVVIKKVLIDPLETAEAAELAKEGSAWYERKMRENLKALAEALP